MFDMFNIPGKSFKGELPPLGAEDKRLSERLKRHVLSLASEIGDRNYLATAKLAQAADYIDQEFTKLGYKAKRQVFSYERESQKYPPGIGMLYPDTGNFIAFVSNYEYKDLLKRSILSFRQNAQFPSEGLAAPSVVPGIDWSDHLQFWAFGYPALMITDTAPYRYADYHLPSDTVDKIDFDSMARVVRGLVNIANEI